MLRQFLKSLILEPPEPDRAEIGEDFDIPANSAILRGLLRVKPTYADADSIKEVRGRYAIMRPIDGHPDLRRYLWQDAGGELPQKTRYVIRGQASFASPETKVIFAMAGGTHSIVVRIPKLSRNDFPELKPMESSESMEPFAWVRSRLNVEEDQRLLGIAYEAAARTST